VTKRPKAKRSDPRPPATFLPVADVLPIRSSSRPGWGDALLFVLVLGVFLPAFRAGFVYDDENVFGNALLRSAPGLLQIWTSGVPGEHYWPVTYTAFWLQFRLWGTSPVGYHVVNVLLHAVNCCLIWRLLARTGVPGSWLAAAIFAVHPLHAESVVWVIELKDVLSGTFYLLAFLAFIRHVETGRPRAYVGSLVLFAAALLSKSIAVTLPVALLLWLWVRRPPDLARHLTRLIPFALVAAAITAVDLAAFAPGSEAIPFTLAERATIAGRAFWFHAWKLVWPVDLSRMYPPWPVDAAQLLQWVPLILAAALAGLLLWLIARRAWLRPAAAILFFGITLGPALGFVYHAWMRYSFVADRFQYLASIGPIALVAAVLSLGSRFAGLTRVAAGAVIVVLATLTWQQAVTYETERRFYETLLSGNPRSWFAHLNLGVYLVDHGAIAEGIEHYREALRLKPDLFEARLNLGVALAETGRTDDALENFEQARALKPDDSEVQNFIGLTLANAGRVTEALPHYQEAVRLQPANADALNNLGTAWVSLGKRDEAIKAFEAAIKADPSHYIAHENLSAQLYLAGRIGEAVRERDEAQRLRALAAAGR
jgi:tetratricopeptide (TPR) repeat protein